jgi:hypothetical protein
VLAGHGVYVGSHYQVLYHHSSVLFHFDLLCYLICGRLNILRCVVTERYEVLTPENENCRSVECDAV